MSKKPSRAGTAKSKAADKTTGPAYWLLKTEPDAFSWDDLKAKGKAGEPWSGVRNFVARNNMKAMKIGDLGFFYHSNIGKEIVGIAEVAKEHYPDPTANAGDPWVVVDIVAREPLKTPVTLEAIKTEPKLKEMALLKQSRLSVQPVTAAEWKIICKMGGL